MMTPVSRHKRQGFDFVVVDAANKNSVDFGGS